MQQPLSSRVGSDADPAVIAAAVLAIWEETDDALTPVIGPLGLIALYRRTVRLAAAQHPWLAGRDEGVLTDTDPAGGRFAELAASPRPFCDIPCRELVVPKRSVAHAPRHSKVDNP